jgi:hypothetical protein
MNDGTATHEAPVPPLPNDEAPLEMADFGHCAPETDAQRMYVDDWWNVQLAEILTRHLMTVRGNDELLAHLRERVPSAPPSHYHLTRVLANSRQLLDFKSMRVGDADVIVRDPMQLVATMVREMQDVAARLDVDFASLFAAQALPQPGALPANVRQSGLYRASLRYVNAAPAGALPVLIDMYLDEYGVDATHTMTCVLRIGLTVRRAATGGVDVAMRQVCTFELAHVSTDAVLAAVMRPFVLQLQRGVLLPATDTRAPLRIKGDLHCVNGDMKERWALLGMKQFSTVLIAQPSYAYWRAAWRGELSVRNLPLVVRVANDVWRARTAGEVSDAHLDDVLDMLDMRSSRATRDKPGATLPELFHPAYKLLQSSIFRFPMCIMHQWTGLLTDCYCDVGALIGENNAVLVNERLLRVVRTRAIPTLNLPRALFVVTTPLVPPRGVARGVRVVTTKPRLISEEASAVLVVLPELLYGLGAAAKRATALVLALHRYFECAKRPDREAAVDAAEWREQLSSLWVAYLTLWSRIRQRTRVRRTKARRDALAADDGRCRRAANDDDEQEEQEEEEVVVVVPELEEQDGEANDEDDEVDRDDDDEPDDEYDEAEDEEQPDEADGVVVGARFSLTPKMRDEFASLPYVRVAGPLEGASTREHEQAHQFPKFIAHHRSSRQPSLVHKTLAKTLSLHATIADERAEQLEARRATKASQFVPFKDGERVAVPDWLQVRGVTRTFACNGFHLGTHRLYLFDFIVVTARLMDGVVRDVHGVLERSVRCTAWRDNAPQREQWVLFMREYDCVRDAGTDSWRVTPCRTARRDQQLAIFSSQVIAIERRFVIKHNDNEDGRRVWFVCKRAPPLRVTIQPRDAL